MDWEEFDLEPYKLKAASAVTATDQEWATLVRELVDALEEGRRYYAGLLDYSDRQYYGTAP